MSIQYALFITILSFVSLGILAGDILFISDPDIVKIIQYADFFICFLFFLDFCYTFYTSKNRVKYFFTWGWLDLISSIPMIDPLRSARVFRIYRLLRIIRGVKAAKILVQFAVRNRNNNAFLAASLISFIVLIISSVCILVLEHVPDANIKTAEDAIWWSYVTMTTVGYGDKYPVTTEGRILAAFLMTIGVGLFGIFSGFVASWFLKTTEEKQNIELYELHTELKEMRLLVEKLIVDKNQNLM